MKHNQNGSLVATIALVVSVLLVILFATLFIWAFEGRQSYKNNDQILVNQAVAGAKAEQLKTDNANFAFQSQFPLVTYTGPSQYGGITIEYPKNWSGYVSSTNGNYPIDGYFSPGILTTVSDSSMLNFALRFRINPSSYASLLQQYDGLQQSNLVSISAYSLPKVPSVVGVKIVGEMLENGQKQSTEIILPLRNESLEIWTEGSQFLNTFNTEILPNISFSP
ncbi:MAG: hypothetical protein M1554_01625 [Patescibacteria group bacterium]|jgi:hypothetical protein|nr:hypothetical protein [Patescibacteria group bacterium]